MHQQNTASECVLENFSLYDALLTIMCAAKFRTNSSSASKNLSDIWNLFMSLWQTPEISSKLIFDLESNTLKYKVGQIQHLIDKYVQEIFPKFSWNQTHWKVIKSRTQKRPRLTTNTLLNNQIWKYTYWQHPTLQFANLLFCQTQQLWQVCKRDRVNYWNWSLLKVERTKCTVKSAMTCLWNLFSREKWPNQPFANLSSGHLPFLLFVFSGGWRAVPEPLARRQPVGTTRWLARYTQGTSKWQIQRYTLYVTQIQK